MFAIVLTVPSLANAQTAAGTNRPLQLADDSPYRDPDIIYLEADELINDEAAQILTAQGQVEGRYQDRTLRADKVVYNLENGRVIASGNVSLIDAAGSIQYAEKLELSNELEAGTAANFTSRFENGGISGASIATRRPDGGIDLYNAYYTACLTCEGKNPTWQLKARRVRQDTSRNMIQYKDAVFEFMGLPFFYTPYLAHPDPTAGRTSGWLAPFGGLSSSKGLKGQTPYYWAIDPYSEITITPHFFQKVNPILAYEYRRKFFSGEVNIEGSFTYASVFDKDGKPFLPTDTFVDPTTAPFGKRLRSHTLANGLFEIDENWDWGFGVQLTTDDSYLNRYDLQEYQPKFGLHNGDGRRFISQIFAVGQDDDFRFAGSAYGFQSLRSQIIESTVTPRFFFVSGEDDATLPILAPKIELTKYFTDPIVGGRLKAFSDVTMLSRRIGTDYTRVTGGVDWNKTFITPGGIEAKPFAQARYDYFKFEPEDAPKDDFTRALGQVGVDIRWPFIKGTDFANFIVEPRAMITQSFGDGKINNFTAIDTGGSPVSLFQDSLDIDFDHSLFWSQNKSTGYDLWQKGFRADFGGSVTALWGDSHVSTFIGKSFARNFDSVFGAASGLSGDNSDFVGEFDLKLDKRFSMNFRARYDDDTNKFRRLGTSLRYTGDRFTVDGRYYRLDNLTQSLLSDPLTPAEEISGGFSVKLSKNWSTNFNAYHDIDRDVTHRKAWGLVYNDQCTRIDFTYSKLDFDNDAIRNTDGFGIRVSLLTLGYFNPDN